MIYFLQRADDAIKTDTTRKYDSRRATLASEHGQLELLSAVEGGRDEEQSLHKQFSFAQVPSRRKTKWLQPQPELPDYIAANMNTHTQT